MRVIDADVLFSILHKKMKGAEEWRRISKNDAAVECAETAYVTLYNLKAELEDEVETINVPTTRARWIKETAIDRRSGKEVPARLCTACGGVYVSYREVILDVEDAAPNFCPDCGAEMEGDE